MAPISDSTHAHASIGDVDDLHPAIAGDVVAVGGGRWALYGTIAVDGNVLVAEYDTVDEARSALADLE